LGAFTVSVCLAAAFFLCATFLTGLAALAEAFPDLGGISFMFYIIYNRPAFK
jgi:hypothetical protein